MSGMENGPASDATGGKRDGRTSVVVVSWQSERFLPGCLESIRAQSHPPCEVFVVDSGSTDGSVDLVRERFHWASVLPLGGNLGFCRACNEGIGRSTGDAILIVNADIILGADFLAEALRPVGRDERIGSVTGKLLRFDRRTVDSAGQCISRSRRVIERGYGQPDEGQFEEAGYVFSACGAAVLYRRRAVEDLLVEGEFFDEEFFAFSEDLDVGWRARNAGWRAWYEPRAVAYHFRGGTAPEAPEGMARLIGARAAVLRRPEEIRYHILKNRYLTMLKNDRPAHVLRDAAHIAAREAALAGIALVSGPRVVGRLARCGSLVASALRKRRAFLSARGVWGERSCGVPSTWVGERLISEPPGAGRRAARRGPARQAGEGGMGTGGGR